MTQEAMLQDPQVEPLPVRTTMTVPSGRPRSSAADGTPVYRLAAGTPECLVGAQASGSQTPWSFAGSPDGRAADRPATDLSAELGRNTPPAHVSLPVGERLQPVGTTAPDDAATEDDDGPLPPVLSDPLLWCASG